MFLFRRLFIIAAVLLTLCASAVAQPETTTLFQNVRVFDGKSGTVSAPSNVLIKGNIIAGVSAADIAVDPKASPTIIAGGGRVLMPGLIEAHWHAMMVAPTFATALTADMGYINLVAGREAEATLMRGFTTVRDMGGPTFGLKRAIDEGLVAGPRIYPSGAFISQTAGHGDFRQLSDIPRTPTTPLSYAERIGVAAIADSPDEVRLRARENLMRGASQVKLMAGGGVSSPFGPLDTTQYTEPELRAAVEAAEDWGTYVAAHAYTPRSIKRAIDAGVLCIEHGHLLDEATARLMADKGIWLSIQPFLDDEDANPVHSPMMRARQLEVITGTDRAYALAKKYKIKTAFGTDVLFDARLAGRQGAQLAKLVRWYTPGEALKMATGDNGQLLALSGLRSPYPGKLGVVEEGALADLLLVDGNPVENIGLISDPARNFVVIMKDGKIFKNALTR
ncbi:MAG TPA: amidohydrolase family protein [Reyranella sp.]|jgi:imidazolonepropionase-like amidohydrolase|nr:amidohydrolase family protein [Reyranella sp.]